MIREALNGFIDSVEWFFQSLKDHKYDKRLKKYYASQGYDIVVCQNCGIYTAEWKVRDVFAHGQLLCKHCSIDSLNKVRLEVLWRTKRLLKETI